MRPVRRAVTVLALVATSVPTAIASGLSTVPASAARAQGATSATSTVVSPGSLVSSSRLASAPRGSRGYAIRYRSVSERGEPIEVTGIAYVPDRTPPAKGWPVLSYAHGTVGLADTCAPSKHVSQLETILAGTFNALGMAVVQTDYEGLGTPGRHPYLVGVSEGRGIIDGVRALRNLPGTRVADRFVVWGHSQGGHAALFAGELAASWAPELKLLGVVAGAPPSQLGAVSSSLTASPYRGYLLMVAAGMQAAYPELDLTKVLTPKGLEVLPVVDTSCNSGIFKKVNQYPLEELVQLNGLQDPTWAAALAANEPGTKRIPAPVLVVHGDADEQIPVATSAALKKVMCANGTSVSRKVYAGADHAGAALLSLFDVATWLNDRVLGKAVKGQC